MRYRIVPSKDWKYTVQRKPWLVWWTVINYCGYGYSEAKKFSTIEQAEVWIDSDIRKRASTAAHLSQPVRYYP